MSALDDEALPLGQRREVVGLVAGALGVLSALSLWSFEGAPAAAQAALAIQQNLVNTLGVVLASVLTRLLGAMAWSVPLELGALAVRQFADRPSRWGEVSLRNAVYIGIPIASVCGLLSVGWPDAVAYREPAGGLIGVVVGRVFLASVGEAGAWVGVVAVVLVAIAARTHWRLRGLVLSTRGRRVERAPAPTRPPMRFVMPVPDDSVPRPTVKIVMPPLVEKGRPTCLRGTHGGRAFALPSSSLLQRSSEGWAAHVRDDALQDSVDVLLDKLEAHRLFGIMDEVHPGPIVTTYAFFPSKDAKLARLAVLADDLALELGVERVRVAPMPGRTCVGLEVPSPTRATIALRPIVESEAWGAARGALPVVVGLDTAGAPVIADLAEMPHLLVGGATGAGKSVGLNAMLVSLLMRRSPDEVRLIMLDPKAVELSCYAGIPHLLLPVVTSAEQAGLALQWVAAEMERRYELLAAAGARNLASFNARNRESMPYLVVVVDEVADLLRRGPKTVEATILRLCQKARAAGIHLVLATQRPSVDVMTGTIRANFPTRIAFRVSRRVDSEIILGAAGAERLLGAGDLLMVTARDAEPKRVHAPYVSEDEVAAICDFLRAQGAPSYDSSCLEVAAALPPLPDPSASDARSLASPPPLPAPLHLRAGSNDGEGCEALYRNARALVEQTGGCSIAALQRALGIGYPNASKLVARLEAEGVVGVAGGVRRREGGRPRRDERASLN